jgi:PPK2 family polyphosphate:nucleotide phosphotransferase
MDLDRFRVPPGTRVRLADLDPSERPARDAIGKDAGRRQLVELTERLAELQQVLYAEHQRSFLVVFQAMDAGGKDGTTRAVFHGVNPQGVQVTSFKQPTERELDHDFLWRIHAHVPGRGELAGFNRSHYEDVLVVRVHELVPEDVWRRRYDHINAFERLLTDSGTTIVKVFLHISKDEQAKRFQERLDEPSKRWKFSRGDLEERKLWDRYEEAFEDVFARTSTDVAPWYIVPANHNWYRNLIVAGVLVDTLEGLRLRYPDPPALGDVGRIV